MRVARSWCGSIVALGSVVLMVVAQSSHASVPIEQEPAWRAAWLTAMQQPNANPNWSQQGFVGQSVRQVVRVAAGGAKIRIRLSNQYGDRTLKLAGASVAKAAVGAATEDGSARTVRFRGAEAVSVPVGGKVASDAVALTGLSSGSRVAVTLYFAEATGPATFHEYGAIGASYRAVGDQRAETSGTPYRESSGSWYFLAGIDTIAAAQDRPGRPRSHASRARLDQGLVIAFGDSVTNGYRTTPGLRYPDLLSARLAAAGRPMPVLNAGLGGNRLLADSACSGERGLNRFQRDVLDQPGVTTAIALIGINDLGYPEVPANSCTVPNPPITAEQLIAGYRTLIREAHARGVRLVGVTMPPFRGAEVHTARSEGIWVAVNAWIRDSGEYDGVVDFAVALADPADPTRLAAQYDSGDHLHPNEAGYRAMADAVDLAML
ncbi:SGNH/GDSL hydrolase family protein [Kribbella sp. NPDC056861]|uniref:SGNH/GDSL hydrolase family protein n=1 Tax=Kribbella sp. NPDC056861 TaxID=3154857 RepID=UPI003425A2CF